MFKKHNFISWETLQIERLLEYITEGYLHLERHINDGSPSGFSNNTTSKRTSPKKGDNSFKVSIIQFDNTIKVIEIGENIEGNLPDNAVFCHPDNLLLPLLQDISIHWREIGTVEVVPTSSGRTVKCLGEKGFFIKLDYFGVLGRLQRNLDKKRLLSAIEVSNCISDALDSKRIGQAFQLFRERYGRIAVLPLSDGGQYELGFVLREEKPYPIKSNVVTYIPFFSLFSKDEDCPYDDPIIIQLFKKQYRNATDFLSDNVIIPTVNFYFDTLTKCGLCLEAHAQNMFLGTDSNFQITSIIVRDMESVDKDLPLREFLNLSTNFKSDIYKCLHANDYNYQILHSFMFDFKFGVYLIDPLIELFSGIGSFNKEKAIEKIRHAVNLRIKELPQDYFPKQWFNYGNQIFEQGEKRPYIAHDNPRYR